MFVFLSHSRENFSLIWRSTITSEGLQILTNARHLWSLSSDCSLACHTYFDTGHPFIMFISKDLWHSQPCRTFDSGAVTICFYNLGLSLLEFEHLTFTLRGKRSNRPRHHRGFENMWIQTIKKVVFATKDAHWYKNVMLQKSVTRGFAVPLHMFLFLQMKQHDLDFPTGENGKTILFFCSFVLGCKVVIRFPLSCL